jgi:hypothetical protein
MPEEDRWIDDFTWIPVSLSELHLACRYYPVAACSGQQTLRLGLLVDQSYLADRLLSSSGRWRGAYRPIALRCFPFQAPTIGDDPLSDVMIDANSNYLSPTKGVPIVDEAGRPARLLTEIHRLLGLLKRSEEALAHVLDQYLIAGLLAPFSGAADSGGDGVPSFHVIDPARLTQLDPRALGAMARRNFLSVDVAVAAAFSLQTLRPGYRPRAGGRSRQSMAVASIVPATTMIDDLSLVLDDGELIPFPTLDAIRPDARPVE